MRNTNLVDTAGQITAVVFGETKTSDFASVSKKLMKSSEKIEQVVFFSENRIQTMGNELCINGSLAGAFLLQNKALQISGLDKPIEFTKSRKFISVKLPLNLILSQKENIILMQGIVYLISNDQSIVNKMFLKKLAGEYNVPASGIIRFKSNKITPIVYVKNTNSLVWENACGSGSLAYSVYSGYFKIIQPSGQAKLGRLLPQMVE